MSVHLRVRACALIAMQRVMLVVPLATAVVLWVCTDAPATTLKLVFSDGQPMTYGSACSGEGCLVRGAGVQSTDAAGEVVLADAPDRVVEYRRDGIALMDVPLGVASGRLLAVGERATVVLARMLLAGEPAVDAVESDLVARINAERGARALAPAVLNTRLSAAADLQATWLNGSSPGLPLPLLSHIGPFGSTLSFRLGEVSFPEPAGGAEVAAAGLSSPEAISAWMASEPHRDQLLAPGALLIGVAKVGSVMIVTTHPPCAGCEPLPAGSGPGALGPDGRALGGTPASGGTPAGLGTPASPAASAVAGSGGRAGSSCGDEGLGVRRLRARNGRLRLRVAVRCLRSGARYTLSVSQRPSRSILATRKIDGRGPITLALRPSRRTRTLRISLKRGRRVVAGRSVNRRPARRRGEVRLRPGGGRGSLS